MSFPYRIERTRNRTSRAVYRDETVVIRLARNLRPHEERDHIRDLLRRMEDVVRREQQRILINPFQAMLDALGLQGPARAKHHRALWKAFNRGIQDDMRRLVETINDRTLRVPIQGVKLRFAKTQWGSCSPKGMITLNPALLFVPETVRHYVIVHELAHCLVPNHSARFWRTVERAMPDYRAARDLLHGYRLPSS